MNDHTPAPWFVEQVSLHCDGDTEFYTYLSSEEWSSFCRVVTRFEGETTDNAEGLANVRLIMAAPRMRPIVQAVAALYFAPDAKDETPIFGTNGAYITVGHVKAARAVLHGGEQKLSTGLTPLEQELLAALKWYVEHDETYEGDEPLPDHGGLTWSELNAFWVRGKHSAMAVIAKAEDRR